MQDVTIAVVGLGGYGEVYLEGLLDKKKDHNIKIVAGIDPEPQRCRRLAQLKQLNIPLYASIGEFYQKGGSADLVILSSPIQLHRDHTCLALQQGSNVLCEKPLGATIQEARDMIQSRDKSGKFVAIGYQWSFTDQVQALKADIRSGMFGKPIRLKTLALWPRDESYYQRNSWAGQQKTPDGRWILDSPVNNAVAHYLHNMLYVLGDSAETSAVPAQVTAELYRANNISNYDTAALSVKTVKGVDILFYVSHAVPEMIGPIKSYEFEKATVSFNGLFSDFIATFEDGSTKKYGSPDPHQVKKMWDCIRAVRTGETILCGPEAAAEQTRVMNGAQESADPITDFPADLVKISGAEGQRLTFVRDLQEHWTRCYESNLMPSDADIAWAKKGRTIDLTDYTHFSQKER